MPFKERMIIVQALKPVTQAIGSIDEDDTVSNSLKFIHEMYKVTNKYDILMFCNGGDRTYSGNTPEHNTCVELGIEPVYGLGEKVQSSSWLIKKSK